jgi:putative hemolysin
MCFKHCETKIALGWLLLTTVTFSYAAAEDYAAYCRNKGGSVVPMTTWYSGPTGTSSGWTQLFCTFERDNGFIVIGLETFASSHPNIAATYMKKLPEIDEKSSLFQGGAHNPSYNVCQNLGGTAINYKQNGTFRADDGGDSDICVFGDGSMISAWSLIYMANHRQGYDEVKQNARALPLPLTLAP